MSSRVFSLYSVYGNMIFIASGSTEFLLQHDTGAFFHHDLAIT